MLGAGFEKLSLSALPFARNSECACQLSKEISVPTPKTPHTHYILVDFENVQPKSLEAFEKDHFKILLFVGASQAKLPFEVVSSVQRIGTRAE